MRIPLVFNELSAASTVSNSIWEGRQRMSDMLKAITLAKNKGMSSGVCGLRQGALNIVLAPEYSAQKWRNDREVNRDERELLRVYATKDPPIPERDDSVVREVRCGGDAGNGLLHAQRSGLMTISIRSNEVWDSPTLQVTVDQLGTATVDRTDEEIPNACREQHVESNDAWIRKRLRDSLPNTATDLNAWVQDNVPHLLFCPKWADSVQRSQDMARAVAGELAELEAYVAEWGSDLFDSRQHPYPGDTSPDSSPTLQRYYVCRTFPCPDGVSRVFSQHLKLYDAWRIYIFPRPDQGRCYVGYAGPHLPTVNDPT